MLITFSASIYLLMLLFGIVCGWAFVMGIAD